MRLPSRPLPLRALPLRPPTSLMRSLVVFSERFGSMLSRIFLTLLYFVVLGPFALLYQLAADPLRIKRQKQGNWATWNARNETLAAARRQD